MNNDYKKYLPAAAVTTTATVAMVSQPAMAQTSAADATAEVTGIITAIGTIAGLAIAVAVAPMAWSMGARIFRKVMR